MADEDKPFWSPPAADPALVAFRRQFDAARDPQTARNALGIVDDGSGGGGGGAPLDAEYITAVDDPTLSNDRALTDTATVTWDFSTPGQAKANASGGGGGGGNVSNSGTPLSGQYGRWVTSTTIAGVSVATVLSDIGAQPLDADLTSLAAASDTDAIYYRVSAGTWAPVTIGSGLSFTAGELSATSSSFTGTSLVSGLSFVTSGVTTASIGAAIGFSAHKNGTAQTSVASGLTTFTKITFTTEQYDQGSYYDAANSKWVPPSGLIHLDAALYSSSATTGVQFHCVIYKNGTEFKRGCAQADNIVGAQVSINDNANGTDYYEVYLTHGNGLPLSVDGGASLVYFSGFVVK